MPDSLQLSAVDHLAHDRINDLYAIATETHSGHRDRLPATDAETKLGIVTRTRSTLGRRLISLGSAVAGQPH